MKKWQRILCVTGTVLAASSLAACGSKSASKDGDVKLLMYQVGDKPDNFDELMTIANKRIKEKQVQRLTFNTLVGVTGTIR